MTFHRPSFAFQWLVALMMALAPFARADDADLLVKTVSVKISASEPSHVAGLKLFIWRYTDSPAGMELVKSDLHFDDSGSLEIECVPGKYRFEVGGSLDRGRMVALRSEPVIVNDRKKPEVTLASFDAGEIAIRVEKDNLVLKELAVRSCGPAGEAVHTADFSGKIRLIVTPEESYKLRFTASSSDESSTYVGWETWKAAASSLIEIRRSQYNNCSFTTRSESISPGPFKVTVHFPSHETEISATADARFYTNRDYVLLSYVQDVGNGSIHFMKYPYRLSRKTKIELGGPLRATGFADAVHAREDDGEGARLFWVVSLADKTGHVVHPKKSSIDLQTYASLDGGEWIEQPWFQDIDAKTLNSLEKRLKLRLTSKLPGLEEINVPPQPFIVLKTTDFTLRIPEAWTFQGQNYLAKLARLKRACQLATRRPGPAHSTISWRVNVNDAWAAVGSAKGGQKLWMSMQMKGLADDDPYSEPWAMCHEMLHNFGYGHGLEMSKTTAEAKQLYLLSRWKAWDDRSYAP